MAVNTWAQGKVLASSGKRKLRAHFYLGGQFHFCGTLCDWIAFVFALVYEVVRYCKRKGIVVGKFPALDVLNGFGCQHTLYPSVVTRSLTLPCKRMDSAFGGYSGQSKEVTVGSVVESWDVAVKAARQVKSAKVVNPIAVFYHSGPLLADSRALGNRQREQKHRAVVQFAFCANGSLMGQHDVLGDGEAEAGAAGFAGACLVHAIEALEQARQVLGGDSRSEVTHVELHC